MAIWISGPISQPGQGGARSTDVWRSNDAGDSPARCARYRHDNILRILLISFRPSIRSSAAADASGGGDAISQLGFGCLGPCVSCCRAMFADPEKVVKSSARLAADRLPVGVGFRKPRSSNPRCARRNDDDRHLRRSLPSSIPQDGGAYSAMLDFSATPIVIVVSQRASLSCQISATAARWNEPAAMSLNITGPVAAFSFAGVYLAALAAGWVSGFLIASPHWSSFRQTGSGATGSAKCRWPCCS